MGLKQEGFNKLKALARVSHEFPGSGRAPEEMGRTRCEEESTLHPVWPQEAAALLSYGGLLLTIYHNGHCQEGRVLSQPCLAHSFVGLLWASDLNARDTVSSAVTRGEECPPFKSH